MYTIFIFLIASCISFLGSLQAGPLNLYVLNTALSKNRKTAIFVAIGGILPEIIYSILALLALGQMNQFEWLVRFLKIVFSVILVILALVLWFKKSKEIGAESTSVRALNLPAIQAISKGFVVAGFNPQLFPFWLFVLIELDATFDLKVVNMYDKVSFCLGTAFGAFCLQYMLILFSEKFSTKIKRIAAHPYFYKIISFFFVSLALQQLFSLHNI
jgi:threonine/homoserine/homoserine lactone efflux protein